VASAVRNDRGRWLARWKDASGRWRKRASAVNTKAAARELAAELEFHVRRQRAGLEPLPAKDGGGTLGDLLTWWLETYSRGTPSHERTEYTVRKHLLRSELAAVRLQEFTSGQLERFLQAKVADYSAQTVNHLRRFVLTAFNCARRAGRWLGPNPGGLMRADVALEGVLRRALARAGVVEAYRHICRRKGCTARRSRPPTARPAGAPCTAPSSGPNRKSAPSASTTCGTRPRPCCSRRVHRCTRSSGFFVTATRG